MNWLSIDEFIPPTGCDLFLRIFKRYPDDTYYERYVVARLECINLDNNDIVDWELSNGATLDIEISDYVITHFAIIDAVRRNYD